VVEADWPEYEPTWKAIEARMMGSPKESALQTAARIMNIELIRERDDQYGTFPQAFRAALAVAPEAKL
jgi:hypothetical protein